MLVPRLMHACMHACTLQAFIQLETKRGVDGLALPFEQLYDFFVSCFIGMPQLYLKDNHIFVVFSNILGLYLITEESRLGDYILIFGLLSLSL